MTVLFAGGVLLAVLIGVTLMAHKAIRRLFKALNPAWLWFSGHAMDGHARTNATWTMPSRGPRPVLHASGHAVAWHHLPRLHRAGVRTGASLAFVAVVYGLVTALTLTLVVLALAAAAGLLALAWHVWYRVHNWQTERHYVKPLERTLIAKLPAAPVSLEVERDGERVKRVAIEWAPEAEIGEPEKMLALEAVTARLALEAPEVSWETKGRARSVVFTPSQPPPARVPFDEIRPLIESAKPHEVIVGRGRRNELVKISVDNDSPHLGLSMGSGDGKSTVAKNFAAQLAWHGALLVILDYKLISHMWARGLPNVAYAGTPAEIHQMLMWLAGSDWDGTGRESEIERRNRVALAGADIDGEVHADVGPRIFIIAEELNATQNRLAAYWRTALWEKGMPKRSPASEALDEILFLGRQVHVNVLQIGQRLSVKATSGGGGGGDSRENLGVKVFCDPSAATWRMLCEGLPQPAPAGHLGRIQVVTRKTVREVQGAYVTGQQARDFAVAGTVAVPRHDMPLMSPGRVLVPAGAHEALPPSSDQPFVQGQDPLVPLIRPGVVTLSEAVAAGVFGDRSLAAVRKAMQRADDPPRPVGSRGAAHEYDINDLYALARR